MDTWIVAPGMVRISGGAIAMSGSEVMSWWQIGRKSEFSMRAGVPTAKTKMGAPP